MKVFAKPGTILQQVGGDCPDGFIVMQSQRPDGDYVAKDDGTWGRVEPEIVTPLVDEDAADMWEAILTLSAKLDALGVK